MNITPNNRNAIFVTIDNNYSFAIAVLLLSLKNNSYDIFSSCDIIVFHNGISEENRTLLSKLHKNIFFIYSIIPDNWNVILNHKVVKKWGIFVIIKLFGYFLVQKYEKALYLDADILISKDISEIFKLDTTIAWRKVKSWEPNIVFKDFIKDKKISAPNGGVILFTNKLNKYNINNNYILEVFNKIKNLSKGRIDERILCYINIDKNIVPLELDDTYNISTLLNNKDEVIVHFYDANRITKPWKSESIYTKYPEWAYYYNQWIKMGGTGPIDTTQNTFYNDKRRSDLVYFSVIWSKIFRKLSVLINLNLKCSFDFSKNYISFFIKNLPNSINYKIIIDNDTTYRVCIYLEDQNILKLFNIDKIFSIIKKDIEDINVKIRNDKKIIIEKTVKINNIDNVLNTFINNTINIFVDSYFSHINVMRYNLEENLIDFQNTNNNINELYRNCMFNPYRSNVKIGNRLILIKDNGDEEEISQFPKLDIVFKGSYATIKIHQNIIIQRSLRIIAGNGAYVIIEKGVNSEAAVFDLSSKNSLLFIKQNSTIRNLKCFAGYGGENINIIIGKDCMFSLNVVLRPTDVHTILDINNTCMPINITKFGIIIGDHVWVGHDVFVLKDVFIPNNCIIGARTLLTRNKYPENSIIAGNPGKVIKTGILWDRLSIEKFLNQKFLSNKNKHL